MATEFLSLQFTQGTLISSSSMSDQFDRYLGGDVVIQSLQNYGTDVVIYLPSNAKDLIEVLPVFTAKTKEYYNSQSRKKTWITGKSSEKGDIVFDS